MGLVPIEVLLYLSWPVLESIFQLHISTIASFDATSTTLTFCRFNYL